MNAYINDANNQAEYMQAIALTDEVSGIQAEISNMEMINAAINSNPQLGTGTLSVLSTMGNGVIALNSLEYDGTTGAIHIVGTANNEKEAARYIERLKGTQYFTGVDYTGYAQVTTTTGYSFVADAYLKAGDSQ